MTSNLREALTELVDAATRIRNGHWSHWPREENDLLGQALRKARAAIAADGLPPEPVAPAIEYLMNEAARELLEMAAKVAGIDAKWDGPYWQWNPLREALAELVADIECSLKTNSRDKSDWLEDAQRWHDQAEAALAGLPPEPAGAAIEYLMNEAARGLLKINATPEDVANSLAAIKSLGIAAAYSAANPRPAAAPADGGEG